MKTDKMKNKKEVKEWGSSLVIVLDKEDCKIHGITKGSVIDITDMMVVKNGK